MESNSKVRAHIDRKRPGVYLRNGGGGEMDERECCQPILIIGT